MEAGVFEAGAGGSVEGPEVETQEGGVLRFGLLLDVGDEAGAAAAAALRRVDDQAVDVGDVPFRLEDVSRAQAEEKMDAAGDGAVAAGEDEVLIRVVQDAGEVGAKGLVLLGRAEEVRLGRRVDRLDLGEEVVEGVEIGVAGFVQSKVGPRSPPPTSYFGKCIQPVMMYFGPSSTTQPRWAWVHSAGQMRVRPLTGRTLRP